MSLSPLFLRSSKHRCDYLTSVSRGRVWQTGVDRIRTRLIDCKTQWWLGRGVKCDAMVYRGYGVFITHFVFLTK